MSWPKKVEKVYEILGGEERIWLRSDEPDACIGWIGPSNIDDHSSDVGIVIDDYCAYFETAVCETSEIEVADLIAEIVQQGMAVDDDEEFFVLTGKIHLVDSLVEEPSILRQLVDSMIIDLANTAKSLRAELL